MNQQGIQRNENLEHLKFIYYIKFQYEAYIGKNMKKLLHANIYNSRMLTY